MNRKTITLVLSFAVLISFFTPLFEWHSFEMSGLNYILSTHIPSYKYFLILIPFSTVILFFEALDGENYMFRRSLMSALPFLVSIFILVIRYITREPNPGDNFFSGIAFGFWMVLGFSLLLMLARARKETLQYY
ncbi:MAG TPA: hypothetical protein VGQ53_11120 [Chitinophagaceae bacterium]|jgi:hypothetical protein|nr:hypothetical protein [Chitinophagaceae bacterium]